MFLWIVIIVVTCFALNPILRAVIVPQGPFPRCRRCRYDVGSLQLPTKCPECGTELVPAAVLTAREAAARIPSADGVVVCVLAIALMWIAPGAAVFQSNWPWYTVASTGLIGLQPDFVITLERDGTVKEAVQADRKVWITYELFTFPPRPPHDGEVTVKVRSEGGPEVGFEMDWRGMILSADDGVGVSSGSKLDVSTMQAVYKAAGLDADSDPTLKGEAVLLHAQLERLIIDPTGFSRLPAYRSMMVGDATIQMVMIRGSTWQANKVGAVIPIGASFLPLSPWLPVACLIVVVLCLCAVLRHRSRVVEHMAKLAGGQLD